jgi:signal transduction histidine kinase
MLKLVHDDGRSEQRAFDVGERPLLIGRAVECDVCIPHKSLSRQHARVERGEGGASIIDLDSKNGTFVNGVRVARRAIGPGDTLRLGDMALAVVDDDGPSRTPPLAEGASGPSLLDAPGHATLLKNLTRLSIDELLRGEGASGALRIEEVEAGRRAQRKLHVLLKVGRLVASPRGIDGVIEQILDEIFSVLDVRRASVLLFDDATRSLRPRVVRSVDAADGGALLYDAGLVEHVYETGEAALVDDDERATGGARRGLMCVPLRPTERTIGVLYVDGGATPRSFSEEDLEFLAAFAMQAAIVIDNSLLYARLEAETVSRMQQIMEAKLASLGSVVAGIAHEIKNPLNFINNFAELSQGLTADLRQEVDALRGRCAPGALADADELLALLADNTAKIGDHGRRATSIIDRMLGHARGRSATREAADLNAVLAESLRVAITPRDLGPDFSVEIDAAYDASILPFEMVAADLSRVFVNIVQNACYAMRQKRGAKGPAYGPRLTVRTANLGARVEVRLHDNGTGIAAEIAGKIFDPFFTTKPPGEGTGLGLSLSHDIVVQGHQGSLQARSEPGAFTELVLTLPTSRPPPP